MAGLGEAASVIAVLEFSGKLVSYIGDVKDASKDRTRLRNEIRACKYVLEQLKDDADDSEAGKAWTDTIQALELPDGPLHHLQEILCLVERKLKAADSLKNSLKWPFQEKDVRKLISAIEQEKSLLTLALSNNSGRLLQEIRAQSKEGKRQFVELIQLFKDDLRNNQNGFQEVKDDLSAIHTGQAGLQSGIDSIHERQNEREASKKRQAILNWLSVVDHASQQLNALEKRQADTGQWLLTSDAYQTWLSTTGQTLFCPGIPGAGKTTLTSIIVEDLWGRYHECPDVGRAFLYCDYTRHQEQNIKNLLASLLKQLVEGRTTLSKSITDLYDHHDEGRRQPPLTAISEALQKEIASLARVFIVVDALDECQETSGCRTQLLSELFALQKVCRLNILATSRFIPDITEKFEGSVGLEIRASSEDVRKYVEAQMFRLPKFIGRNMTLQTEIKARIIDSIDGMFLLARLHLDSLVEKTTVKAVRNALQNLKTGAGAYDFAYAAAVERIKGQPANQEELAMQVLGWIICAKRPLRGSELQVALGVEFDDRELDLENCPDVETMLSVCAGLVSIDEGGNGGGRDDEDSDNDESDDEDSGSKCGGSGEEERGNKFTGQVRLVHYTAQEYFSRTQRQWFPDAEAMITNICTTYLSLDVFGTPLPKRKKDTERYSGNWDLENKAMVTFVEHLRASTTQNEHLDTNDLYAYAATNWGHHARLALSSHTEVMDFLARPANVELSGAQIKHTCEWRLWNDHEAWFKKVLDQFFMAKYIITSTTQLHLAAYFGLETATTTILEDFSNVDVRNSEGATALMTAAGMGHESIAKLLLDRHAAVDAKNDGEETSLIVAVQLANYAVAKLLLCSGTDVTSVRIYGFNALCIAAQRGLMEMVELLLDHGAEVNCGDAYTKWPLIVASTAGKEALVKFLLHHGAEIECQDKDGNSPLIAAAKEGHETVVELLLNAGANITVQTHDGETALYCAAREGKHGVVKQLAAAGIDVNLPNKHGDSPLFEISNWEDIAMTKLLIDLGADVNHQNKAGCTALMGAAISGQDGRLKMLLEHGADSNVRKVDGDTALSYAKAMLAKWNELREELGFDEFGKEPWFHEDGHIYWFQARDEAGFKACIRLLEEYGAK